MDTYSFQDSLPARAPFSRACDWCEATAQLDDKLKRCSGCSVVVYCGKNCQTAAWPTHKHMCGSRSKEETTRLGHASTASIARALDTWVNMHAWSLGTIAEATAHTGLGVDFHLENRRAVLFMLLARRRDPNGPNDPAKAFVLEGGGLVGKDEQSFLRAHWPRLERTCKIMTDAMQATLDEAERYAFAGFIPAAFHFKTTGIVAFHQFPLFRLWAHGCGPSYGYHSVAENNTLFDDVARLWGLLVNRGLLFRARYNDNEPVLAAELCAWSGKSWKRVLSDRKWDTQDVVLDSPEPSQYSSGLSPATIYKRYHKFLARRNFRFVTTRRQKLIFTVGKKGDISAVNATSGSTLEVDVETERDKRDSEITSRARLSNPT